MPPAGRPGYEPRTLGAGVEIVGACLRVSVRRRSARPGHSCKRKADRYPRQGNQDPRGRFSLSSLRPTTQYRKANVSHHQGKGSPALKRLKTECSHAGKKVDQALTPLIAWSQQYPLPIPRRILRIFWSLLSRAMVSPGWCTY